MKRFIEVTDYERGFKVLCAIDKITVIVNDEIYGVFIEMGTDVNGESSGFVVKETYDEIKEKLSIN